MQPDDPLALIRFGVHPELGMVMYCSDSGHQSEHLRWRVGVNEMDTLPMLNERALDHVAARHVSRENMRVAVPDVLVRSVSERPLRCGRLQRAPEGPRAVLSEDGRLASVTRRMWRRWWMGMSVDDRESVCVELCVLPRGTASDDGWLRVDAERDR